MIGDLGLAELANAENYLYVRCGTPGYVAPEVINLTNLNGKYTTACDIYSLGLIFHIMLVGKPLFPGKNYDAIMQQNRKFEYKIGGGIYSRFPVDAIDLLAKMLIKDPLKRISSEEALEHPFIQRSPKKHTFVNDDLKLEALFYSYQSEIVFKG